MFEFCSINSFRSRQMILLLMFFLGLTACTTLQPGEKKAALSPPDINQGAPDPGETTPTLAESDRLVIENGGAAPAISAGANRGGNKIVSDSDEVAGLGIKIIGIRWSAAGYMMDFRYTVINPDEALPMFDRAVIPYLVHEKSGARFAVPNPAKVGPLRATTKKPEAGKIYFIMFANPGRYVPQGDLVTVVVGDHRFEHLALQ